MPKRRDIFDTGPNPFLVDEEETCRCGHYIEDHSNSWHVLQDCSMWDCLCPSFVEGNFDEL